MKKKTKKQKEDFFHYLRGLGQKKIQWNFIMFFFSYYLRGLGQKIKNQKHKEISWGPEGGPSGGGGGNLKWWRSPPQTPFRNKEPWRESFGKNKITKASENPNVLFFQF